MKSEDEIPLVGELWTMFDPYDSRFWEGYVIKKTSSRWRLLDVDSQDVVTVISTHYF